MRLLILHLSDIHFEDGENPVIERRTSILGALRSIEFQYDACLIAVSGDVAFSGAASQYKIAELFFSTLETDIKELVHTRPVDVVCVPGNHDCDFSKIEKDLHEVLITSIPSRMPTLEANSGILSSLISLQDNFFDFESWLTKSSGVLPLDNRLFYKRTFTVGDTLIQLNCYNTAWDSQIKEKQGQLFYPTKLVKEEEAKSQRSGLVITLFHHPYGWLEANNSLEFESLIDSTSDIVLTGHEHVEKYVQKRISTGEEINYSKGAVLQETGKSISGFNFILIDLDARQQKIFQYHWKDGKYTRLHESEWLGFIRNKKLTDGTFTISTAFAQELKDIGAAFTHPRIKGDLTLQDLFIYPDFSDHTFDIEESGSKPLRQKGLKGEQLIPYIRNYKQVIIIGGDTSGKSALAKVIFTELKDMVPVLVSGQELDGPDTSKFRRSIGRAFAREYSSSALESFEQLDRARKALIIDDFHKSKFKKASAKAKIFEAACELFDIVIILVDDIYRVEQIAFSNTAEPSLYKFRQLEIREFGFVKRGRLIKKWVQLGQDGTVDEKQLLVSIADFAKLVQRILGKNILPSYPLPILTVLQTWEATQSHDMQAGSYGHLYEELITRALRSDKNDPEDVDQKYTFISMIAYRIFSAGQSGLSNQEVKEVYQDYVRLYNVSFNTVDMIRELEEARILHLIDGNYRFKYKYIYYYFVARYLKENLANPDEADRLQAQLLDMADRVHVGDYANILTFYVFRTKDRKVIQRLLENAKRIYDEFQPSRLEGDVEFINKLYKEMPALELPESPVEENQERHWANLDKTEENDDRSDNNELTIEGDDEEEKYSRELSDLGKVNMALKSLQVIGQILRNSPGSLRGDLKFEITKEGYKLGLRVLAALLSIAETNLDVLRSFYMSVIGEKRDIRSDKELLRLADGVLIEVTQGAAYGLIKTVSHALGHEKLGDIYKKVLREEGESTANKLIDLSIKLDHFKSVPENDISNINKMTRKNVFALAILRDMVVNFLYLFPAEQDTRQKLGKLLGFKTTDPKMLVSPTRKLLRE